jgi:hypothetical protein
MLVVLRAISLGGALTMPVGDGTDPNHEPPYLVLRRTSTGLVEGPMDDLDADEEVRWQVNGVGVTAEQAELAIDMARLALTEPALTAALTAGSSGRVCQYISLDFSQEPRNDLGVTEPLFEAVDQYMVKTTPA